LSGVDWSSAYSTSPVSLTGITGRYIQYRVDMSTTDDSVTPTFYSVQIDADDNSRVLSYWIESKTDGDSANVWVKVPRIPSGTKEIYLYYGNPNASSESNGDNVFEFFDDFEGTSIDTNKWTKTSFSKGSYSISNSVLTLDNNQASYGEGGIGIISKEIGKSSYIVESRFKREYSNTGNQWCYMAMGAQTEGYEQNTDQPNKGVGIGVTPYNNYLKIQYHNENGGHDYIASYSNYWETEWTKGKIKVIDSTNFYFYWKKSTASDYEYKTSYTYSTVGNRIYLHEHWHDGYDQKMYIDWVFVRKYASPEPTCTLGDEEIRYIAPKTFIVKKDNGCSCDNTVCPDPSQPCEQCYGTDGTDGYCCQEGENYVCRAGGCTMNDSPVLGSIAIKESSDPSSSDITQITEGSDIYVHMNEVSDTEGDSLHIYCCQDTENTCTPTTSDTCLNDKAWTSEEYGEMYCQLKAPYVTSDTDYYVRCALFDTTNNNNSETKSDSYKVLNSPYSQTGTLISATFDTEISQGVAYNSIIWQGEMPSDSKVEIELATSNCPNGATNPPDCDSGTWNFKGENQGCWVNLGPNQAIVIKNPCRKDFNNKRYYRYKVILYPSSDGKYSPTVEKVIVNYSP